MADLVYGLCTLMSLLCAFLLLRSYFRTKFHLLLWSGLCFVGLSLNNFLLVVDRMVSFDLSIIRLIPAVIGMILLVYGLICEEK